MAKKATNSKIKDKKQAIDVNVLEEEKDVKKADLLAVNPLLGSQVITVDDENEQKVELMEEAQSLSILNREVLEVKRRQVELEVDNKKLDAANKLIDGINIVADKALNEETIKKIIQQPNLTPQDLKYMAEAMEKMSNTLKGLMNPSIQDEYGNRKRTKIIAQFQTQSGERASIGVSINNND